MTWRTCPARMRTDSWQWLTTNGHGVSAYQRGSSHSDPDRNLGVDEPVEVLRLRPGTILLSSFEHRVQERICDTVERRSNDSSRLLPRVVDVSQRLSPKKPEISARNV